MPELPEVETVRRGLSPIVVGRDIRTLEVRDRRLRWPVSETLGSEIVGSRISAIDRRGKYLLFRLVHARHGQPVGDLVAHLGMSGRLVAHLGATPAVRKHDHIDLQLSGDVLLRLSDPRRFGALFLIAPQAVDARLAKLGVEPLSDAWNRRYLHAATRGRRSSIKSLLMNAEIVVGVGNIYASESLFEAGIRPGRAAHRLSLSDCERLTDSVRTTLERAIAAGGTTLKDFLNGDGKPGYFAQELAVYDRAGEACGRCGATVKTRRDAGRSTFYCPRCQR